jgi:glycosyltransferase involved in cell wall biosynthesis
MRLLFVVQRYGPEVAGGAELCCRQYATHLAARGHSVDVLTSCAVSYVDWDNTLPAGTEELEGVRVHRLPVRRPRDNSLFGPLHIRVVEAPRQVPLYVQREWMWAEGPLVDGLEDWLDDRAGDYEVAGFFTYLYYTTWAGLPVASNRVPTVLHPTAHDEPPLSLRLFDATLHLPSAFGFLTEEERELVRRRFDVRRPSSVLGVGVDLDVHGDGAAFRDAYGLEERPYLVCVGRIDPDKGAEELYDFFVTHKERQAGPLALVMVGEAVKPLPPHPDVVVTGFVDDHVKRSAMAGALALVHPSYYESFSMALTEAWAQRKAALVQGRCDVLLGQARRSGGAIPYFGFAEFEAAVELLTEDAHLVDRLGQAGRRYVEAQYQWPVVLDRYERLLRTTARLGRVAV